MKKDYKEFMFVDYSPVSISKLASALNDINTNNIEFIEIKNDFGKTFIVTKEGLKDKDGNLVMDFNRIDDYNNIK